MMNKRGGGPSDTIVSVWSWIFWVFVILIFILLFNLRSCVSGHEAGEDAIEGQIDDKIRQHDTMLAYLTTPLTYCELAEEKIKPLTHAELITLIMKGNPKSITQKLVEKDDYEKKFENKEYSKYLKLWHECNKKYFGTEKTLKILVNNHYKFDNSFKTKLPLGEKLINLEMIFDKAHHLIYVQDQEAIKRMQESTYEASEPFSGEQ